VGQTGYSTQSRRRELDELSPRLHHPCVWKETKRKKVASTRAPRRERGEDHKKKKGANNPKGGKRKV